MGAPSERAVGLLADPRVNTGNASIDQSPLQLDGATERMHVVADMIARFRAGEWQM